MKKPKILIAEDKFIDYEMLLQVLRKELGEFDHIRTMTNKLAVSLLGSQDFDAVVYDLELLDVRNGEGLQHIVEAAGKVGTRVFILTGDILLEAEIKAYITKADGLYEKTEVLCEEKRSRDFGAALRGAVLEGVA